jgi:hypothetical protein
MILEDGQMILEEKHKEFVVRHIARFTELTDIVEAFIEEFEDELPPVRAMEALTLEEMIAQDLANADLPDEDWTFEEPNYKTHYMNKFIREHEEEFREKYGDEADKLLNKEVLKAYEDDVRIRCMSTFKELRMPPSDDEVIYYKEKLRENLYDQFSSLDIDHPRFPNKYRALFQQTRNEYYENHHIQDLSITENLGRELETLYGFQKQLIYKLDNPKEILKQLNSAHQILKTILAHNTVNANQQVVDITPQNVKALEDTQKALVDELKQVTQQLSSNTDTSNGSHNA